MQREGGRLQTHEALLPVSALLRECGFLSSLQFLPVTITGSLQKCCLSLGHQAAPGPWCRPPPGNADWLPSLQSLLLWEGLVNMNNGDCESRISSKLPLSLEHSRASSWGRDLHPNEE